MISIAPYLVFAASLLLSLQAATAQASIASRVAGYVEGCRAAVLSGDLSAFSDLSLETETITETVAVRGWRGTEEGGLTVSLMQRGASAGVCDVSYRPLGPAADLLRDLSALAETLAVDLLAEPSTRSEMAQAGQVILTCVEGRGMAMFLDPTAKGQGFAAQIATVPASRIACGG